jgi:hypothetical protein
MQECAVAAPCATFVTPSSGLALGTEGTRRPALCVMAEANSQDFVPAEQSIADAAARLNRVKQYAAVFSEEGLGGEARKFNVRKVWPTCPSLTSGAAMVFGIRW